MQIVTDNGSTFVKAGKLLMKKYNLYQTPYAAHCIDLMFENISKRESFFDLITNARKISNFIYNHGWLLATMRKVCGGEIVRPGATRFAINYIALASLLKKRADEGTQPEFSFPKSGDPPGTPTDSKNKTFHFF